MFNLCFHFLESPNPSFPQNSIYFSRPVGIPTLKSFPYSPHSLALNIYVSWLPLNRWSLMLLVKSWYEEFKVQRIFVTCPRLYIQSLIWFRLESRSPRYLYSWELFSKATICPICIKILFAATPPPIVLLFIACNAMSWCRYSADLYSDRPWGGALGCMVGFLAIVGLGWHLLGEWAPVVSDDTRFTLYWPTCLGSVNVPDCFRTHHCICRICV